MSESAASIARMDWRRLLGVSAADELLAKTEVLLPPQRVISTPDRPHRRDITEFAFVGGDFYRKGGLEVLEAMWRLYARGVRDWRATVIGRLDSFGDYASATTASDMQRSQELVRLLGGCVTHLDRASNATVLDVLSRSHFFLFPTLADSFGYSVLEAQACGAVVISTNISALPEVNRHDWGLIIHLDLDDRRECHNRGDIVGVRRALIERLEQLLEEAIDMSEPNRVSMAARARANLANRHSPDQHTRTIEARYAAALELD